MRRNTFPGLKNNAEVVKNTLEIIDGMLAESKYIAGPGLSLADICAYEELGQNQAKYANCIDYQPYPHIQCWFLEMEKLPFHEEAHTIWNLLGDLNIISGGMKTVAVANKSAAKTLQGAVDSYAGLTKPG